MIPIPQYPLYSATIAEYGMHPIDYYLDEGNAQPYQVAKFFNYFITEFR